MENRKRERGCERGESGVERKRWKKVESEKGKGGKKEKGKDKEREVLSPFACRSRGGTVLQDHSKGERGRKEGRRGRKGKKRHERKQKEKKKVEEERIKGEVMR